MDNAIKFIVQISCLLVFFELFWRCFLYLNSNRLHEIVEKGHYNEVWSFSLVSLVVSYLVCLFIELSGLKDFEFVKSSAVRNCLTLLHASDGIAAGVLGISMYYRNPYGFSIGQMIISKFFLLSLLNRLILAQKKTNSALDSLTQTTKSYLHHVASFFFLAHPEEILLTAMWRTVSMFGHAMLALRGRLEPSKVRALNWLLAYARIAYMSFLLSVCVSYPSIRMQFAYSAVGHLAYLAVRLGPVFRMGSIYLTDEEKEEWTKMPDQQRLATLLSGKYPFLSIELLLLSSLIVTFGMLRMMVFYEEIVQIGAISAFPILNQYNLELI